jgi:hypothetical protein
VGEKAAETGNNQDTEEVGTGEKIWWTGEFSFCGARLD